MKKTRLLFMRHEVHSMNRLTSEGVEKACFTGKRLRKNGLIPEQAASSPQWRCVQTVQYVLEGANCLIPLSYIETRLGDFEMDMSIDNDIKALVKTTSGKLGIVKEQILYEEERFKPHIRRRGIEGAAALIDLVSNHPGETILVCSHGGSRIEPTISTLLGQDVFNPLRFFIPGLLALLTFNHLNLVSVDFPLE